MIKTYVVRHVVRRNGMKGKLEAWSFVIGATKVTTSFALGTKGTAFLKRILGMGLVAPTLKSHYSNGALSTNIMSLHLLVKFQTHPTT